MESVTREVEDLDKNGSFCNSGTCAQLTLFASIPLLCRSKASSSATDDLIFSSPDTWKRLPRVCSPDGLQSGRISEDFSYTQMRLLDTPHTHL